MLQKDNQFSELIGQTFLKKDQSEALEGLKSFFRELDRYECENYKEPDSSALATSFWTYSSFYGYLTEFRINYLKGEYSEAAYALSEAIYMRPCTYRGSRAAILEAGKIVMKDDFPE